jgi:hypothetical protein
MPDMSRQRTAGNYAEYVVLEPSELDRKLTVLTVRMAEVIAVGGDVRRARALLAGLPDGGPLVVIEVNETVPLGAEPAALPALPRTRTPDTAWYAEMREVHS